jgi:hypothetical protein
MPKEKGVNIEGKPESGLIEPSVICRFDLFNSQVAFTMAKTM